MFQKFGMGGERFYFVVTLQKNLILSRLFSGGYNNLREETYTLEVF